MDIIQYQVHSLPGQIQAAPMRAYFFEAGPEVQMDIYGHLWTSTKISNGFHFCPVDHPGWPLANPALQQGIDAMLRSWRRKLFAGEQFLQSEECWSLRTSQNLATKKPCMMSHDAALALLWRDLNFHSWPFLAPSFSLAVQSELFAKLFLCCSCWRWGSRCESTNGGDPNSCNSRFHTTCWHIANIDRAYTWCTRRGPWMYISHIHQQSHQLDNILWCFSCRPQLHFLF